MEQLTLDFDAPEREQLRHLWRSKDRAHRLEAFRVGAGPWKPRYTHSTSGVVQHPDWLENDLALAWDRIPPRGVASACTSTWKHFLWYPPVR